MISTLVFLLVLSILIIVHEFGHFIVAKKLGVGVEEFSLGFGRKLFGRKKDGTEYSIRTIPLGGYVKLAGDNRQECKGGADEYLSKTPLQRAAIIFFGPVLNYVLGFLCFWFIFFAGYPTLTTRVGGLIDGFGAKEAGIQLGDKIVAVNSKKVNTWEELQKAIQDQKKNILVNLSVLRKDKQYNMAVKIKSQEMNDLSGSKRSVGLIGITPEAEETIKVRHGLGEAFILSLGKTADLTVITYKALGRMVTGRMSIRESVTGPLGIYYITSQAAKAGIIVILQLIAVLSISLAIFNLLPLPVLDGGHILLLAVEKIRGRVIGVKAEQMITRIGISFIVTLALFVTYNDIVRFFGDKIAKWFIK